MKQILLMSLLSLLILAACGATPKVDVSSLPAGDPVRGESIFSESINGAPACSSCHLLSEETQVGPGMSGFAEQAATRVEGQAAAEYTLTSILSPSRYIVNGFGNLMYVGYSSKLDEQQLADLIAYLLTQ
jgi:cytochrome c2